MFQEFQEITIDLRRPPAGRWCLTSLQKEQGRELLRLYKADLGLKPDIGDFLISGAREFVREDYWQEMESLAHALTVPVSDVALCNFYYDALKFVLGSIFGCTAFAVDTPAGILHARNLDWWTENSALTRHTTICHFAGSPAGPFTTIGWPGFIGAFSGIAPGRFAVTLNAVLSLDPPQPAMPVELLLRQVLEEAPTFEQARDLLSRTPIPCDCLLLLTGILPGELVVIERTPSRHAGRGPEAGQIAVTNGYLRLEAGIGGAPSALLASTCERLDRVGQLLKKRRPENPDDCFQYLNDPDVRMNITVQQMVFRAATGEHWISR